MKIKHFFYLLLAMPLIFAACEPDDVTTPDPELIIKSEAVVSIDAAGGNGEISYEIKNAVQGVNLTATANVDWITDVTVGDKVTFTVAANEETESRSGEITLAYDKLTEVITVNQNGKTAPSYDAEFVMAAAARIQDSSMPQNVFALIMGDDAENVELMLGLIGAEEDTILQAGTYTLADGTVDEESYMTTYEPEALYEFTDATVVVTVEEEILYNFDMVFTSANEEVIHVVYKGVVLDMEPAPAPKPETIEPEMVYAEFFDTGNFFLWIYTDYENEVYHGLDMYDLVDPNDKYLTSGHYSMTDGTIDDWSTWGAYENGYSVSYELTAAEIDLTINADNTVTLKGYIESELGNHGDIDWTGEVDGFIFEEETPELSNWTLVGTHNGWDPAAGVEMYVVDGYHVAYGFELTTTSEFKFVKDGQWGGDLGGSATTQPNCYYATAGSNIKVTEAGTYDIYLNAATDTYYVMSEGKLPSEATAPTPIDTPAEWHLMGDFEGNNWATPISLTKDGDYYVAQDVVFANANDQGMAFKVRKAMNWDNDTTFGTTDGANNELNSEISMVSASNGGDKNIFVNGTVGVKYDFYVDTNNLKVWVMEDGKTPGAEEPSSFAFTKATVTNNSALSGGYIDVEFVAGSNKLVVEFNSKTDVIESGTWVADNSYDEGSISASYTKLNGEKIKSGDFVVYRDGSNYNINMTFETANGSYSGNFNGNIINTDGTKMGAPKLEVIEVESVKVGFREADGSEMEIIFYQNDMNKNAHVISFRPTTPNVKYLEAGNYSIAAGTISQEWSFYRYISSTDKAALTSAEFTFTHHDDGTTTIVGEFLTVNEQPCSIEWTGKVDGFDFSVGGENNFTEWESVNGAYWAKDEGIINWNSADGSLYVSLDIYHQKTNDKVIPEGTYEVKPFNFSATDYIVQECEITHNGVKGKIMSGSLTVKHISGGYDLSFELTNDMGENYKGSYSGALGGNATNPA